MKNDERDSMVKRGALLSASEHLQVAKDKLASHGEPILATLVGGILRDIKESYDREVDLWRL